MIVQLVKGPDVGISKPFRYTLRLTLTLDGFGSCYMRDLPTE